MCPLLSFYSQSVHNFCLATLSQRRERRVARRYAEVIKKQICLGSGSPRLLANAKSVQYKGEATAPKWAETEGELCY